MALDWAAFLNSLGKVGMLLGQQQDEKKLAGFVQEKAAQPGMTREQYLAELGQLPGNLQQPGMAQARNFPSVQDIESAAMRKRQLELRERDMTLREQLQKAKGTGDPRKKMADIDAISRRLGEDITAEIQRTAPGMADRNAMREFTLKELKDRTSLEGDTAQATAAQLLELGYDPMEKDRQGMTLTERVLRQTHTRATNKLLDAHDPISALAAGVSQMNRMNAEERRRGEAAIAGVKDQYAIQGSTQRLATTISGAAKIRRLYDLQTKAVGDRDTISALANEYFDPTGMYPEREALAQYEQRGSEMARNLNDLSKSERIAVERRFPDTKKKFTVEGDMGNEVRAALAAVMPYIQFRLSNSPSSESAKTYAGKSKELESKGAKEYVAHSVASSLLGPQKESLEKEVNGVINDLFPGLDKDVRDLMISYTFSTFGSK